MNLNLLQDKFVEIPISSGTNDDKSQGRPASFPEPADPFILSPAGTPQFKQNKVDSVIDWMSKVSKKADSFAHRVCEHVKLAPNLSESMMGKLRLGARIIQSGGVENVFGQNFSIGERELLLKVCQCYLSTTAGPIAGLLFISTEKTAFHSERSFPSISPSGVHRVPYKVFIPFRQIRRADPTENAVRPTEKYIHIVTEDNSEFWFMGFVNYHKAFKCLQGAISQGKVHHPW